MARVCAGTEEKKCGGVLEFPYCQEYPVAWEETLRDPASASYYAARSRDAYASWLTETMLEEEERADRLAKERVRDDELVARLLQEKEQADLAKEQKQLADDEAFARSLLEPTAEGDAGDEAEGDADGNAESTQVLDDVVPQDPNAAFLREAEKFAKMWADGRCVFTD